MPTAAAKRATKADRERQLPNNATVEKCTEKCTVESDEKKKQSTKKDLKTVGSASVEVFPADALIAAAVNSKHDLTVIEAAGHNRSRFVVVERLTIQGKCYHRVKSTSYLYFHSRDEAIENAKKRRVRITEYG